MSILPPLRRGDTPIWRIVVTDYDGSPFNLAGYTIRMTAKRDVNDSDADAVFQLSTTDGTITITDAAGGIAQAQPERSSTDTLTNDIAVYWDVQLAEDGAPNVTYTVDNGTLQIVRDITRTAP
jgi:hypothetical protein